VKQVIVMRADLRNTEGHKIRTGKLVAQGAHAATLIVAKNVFDPRVIDWLESDYTKVVLQVGSEEELQEIYAHARNAGLLAEYVVDNGRTEFGGVLTATCCAIGPDDDARIDAVTGDLRPL
jgi:PTH2 family peptidyl-tRNA hydrolase